MQTTGTLAPEFGYFLAGFAALWYAGLATLLNPAFMARRAARRHDSK